MTTQVAPRKKVHADSRRARGRPSRYRDALWSLVIVVALVGFVEIAARAGWVSPLVLPAPSDVATSLYYGFSEGIFLPHMLSTLGAALIGFACSSVVAIVVAGTLASIPALERILLPLIVAFQTLPKVAVAPLLILWVGFGLSGKAIIVAFVCFLPVLLNSLQGLRIRNREHMELMESLGASRLELFRFVRLPSALPYIFAGLDLGVIFAILGAVVAEFVGSANGLGYLLLTYKATFNVAGVFAILLLLMLLGTTLHTVVNLVEGRVAFWSAAVNPTDRAMP